MTNLPTNCCTVLSTRFFQNVDQHTGGKWFIHSTNHREEDQLESLEMYTISYPLFADADTGIYPHAASQYHARPKAKRGIAMLSVDKFPYPRKQTMGNELFPC